MMLYNGDLETVSDGITERVVKVRRTSKTVKGGRQMGFAALVVVGDSKGKVGCGCGKADDISVAIQKASKQAKRNVSTMNLKNGVTVQHRVLVKYGASKILMIPASEGTGIIAGNAMRAVLEAVGVKDVLAKCIGSSNPINVVRATIKGLKSMQDPRQVAKKRSISVEFVIKGSHKK